MSKEDNIEYSTDGKDYKQMRMLHMHVIMNAVRMGVYACSPLESSFRAVFSEISVGECLWQ